MTPRRHDRPIRIVPLHRPELLAPGRVAPPAVAQLTYRGGPLLTAVEVFSLFWGAAWQDGTLMQSLNAFLQFVVTSPYIDQLGEYSTAQQKIGHGRYAGTLVVTDPAPGTNVADSALQQLLAQQVAKNTVPPPTPNTLYVVFLPSGVTVTAGSDRSCQVFCGYHDRSSRQLYYAVLPYPDCAGCLGGLAPLDALTSVCSHELAEAITDPVPGQGWYDDVNGEIGDICAWQNKKLGAYTVQRLWSNLAKACV